MFLTRTGRIVTLHGSSAPSTPQKRVDYIYSRPRARCQMLVPIKNKFALMTCNTLTNIATQNFGDV